MNGESSQVVRASGGGLGTEGEEMLRPDRAFVAVTVTLALASGILTACADPDQRPNLDVRGDPAVVSEGPAGWPQASFDGGHSDHNKVESAIRPANVDRLRLDWLRRIRPDVPFIYEYTTDPVVVRAGRVFAAWAGSDQPIDVLVALDERTGERLWALRGETWMQPVAATADTLIVAADTRPPSVWALSAATGEPLWSLEGQTPMVADYGVHHVIAVTHRPVPRVSSVEVETGVIAWSRRLRARRGETSILLAHGRVVVEAVGDTGPRLVVLRVEDGTTVWSQPTRAFISIATEGRILAMRSLRRGPGVVLSAVTLYDGSPLWEFAVPSAATVAAAGGGRVFVNRSECVENCEGDYGGMYRGTVIALDAANGHEVWRRGGNELRGGIAWSARVLANGLLFVQRLRYGRATFGALNASAGRVRWILTFGPPGVSGCLDVVADGAVLGGLRHGERGGRVVRLALPDVAGIEG